MAGAIPRAGGTLELGRETLARSHAVPLLQLFALTLLVIPSDTVFKAFGATGYPAALVGMFAFVAFAAATLVGLHNPLRHANPVRGVLCLLWLAALLSYVLIDRSALTVAEAAGADRWLLQLGMVTGVVLVAAELLHSVEDVRRVLRVLCWGGAFCGVVAALQYWISLDLAPYLRDLPGFSLNSENLGILTRGALNRVTGTAVYPIELGVVAGMLLPLAIYLAIYDTERSARWRWAPVALIALAIPTSVSRSAVLSVTVALALLVVLMPVRQRLVALGAIPFGVVAVFMAAPGLIGTLNSFFEAGTSDASVATRVSDYPLVGQFVQEAPWFGRGGGTYIPENVLDVLDNQYLKTAVELGLVGVVVLAAFFLVPVIAALTARRRSGDPEFRLLCAALAGSALAAGVCSLTFDSLAYPMFIGVHALVIGLIGACWRLSAGARAPAAEHAGDRSAAAETVFRGPTTLPAGG